MFLENFSSQQQCVDYVIQKRVIYDEMYCNNCGKLCKIYKKKNGRQFVRVIN